MAKIFEINIGAKDEIEKKNDRKVEDDIGATADAELLGQVGSEARIDNADDGDGKKTGPEHALTPRKSAFLGLEIDARDGKKKKD